MVFLKKVLNEFLQILKDVVPVVVDEGEVQRCDLKDLAHEQNYDLRLQRYFGVVLDAVLRMAVDVA